jgi:hypothetical protein
MVRLNLNIAIERLVCANANAFSKKTYIFALIHPSFDGELAFYANFKHLHDAGIYLRNLSEPHASRVRGNGPVGFVPRQNHWDAPSGLCF